MLWALLISGLAWAGAPVDVARYPCCRAISPIQVDGKLEELAWQVAPRVGKFAKVGRFCGEAIPRSDTRPRYRTEAMMLWDERYFYVAFACEDRDMWATKFGRDDHLWEEEVVEVFVDPDGDGKDYAELEVNPLNIVVDLKITAWPFPKGGVKEGDVEWDIEGLKTAVRAEGTVARSHDAPERKDEDLGWTVEIAIPWDALADIPGAGGAPPRPGDQWRVNLYRIERPRDGRDEFLAWSDVRFLNFHMPRYFGVVEFVEPYGSP